MAQVYLGIGTNLGDRKKNISTAVELLKKHNITVTQISSIIETEPVGYTEQDKFLNGCLAIETTLDPHTLLKTLKLIEKTMGRTETVVNGPRIIDLDILTYDDIKVDTDELTIPHPRMKEREFVLTPLKELNPELVDQLNDARF